MGNKSQAIEELLGFGVQYINGGFNETPISYAVGIHDQDSIDVMVNHLSKDANQLEYIDTEYMIKNFNQKWRNNFMFQPAKFTNRAQDFLKN